MRPLLLPFLLAGVAACNADVFTSGDAATDGGVDGGALDGASDALTDGITNPPDTIACAVGICSAPTQECCVAPNSSWDKATCQATAMANATNCLRFLSCDDTTDCPNPGDECCADLVPFDGSSLQVILATHCTTTCAPDQVQLCNVSGECSAGTCNDWNGTPSWVKTCQP